MADILFPWDKYSQRQRVVISEALSQLRSEEFFVKLIQTQREILLSIWDRTAPADLAQQIAESNIICRVLEAMNSAQIPTGEEV